MKAEEKPGIGEKLETLLIGAGILYLLACLLCWLIQRKWGTFLILWVLWFLGAIVILGGALTMITGDADVADQVWPCLLFAIAAAVMTGVQRKACEK